MPNPKPSEAWEHWLFKGFSLVIPLIVVGIHYPFKAPVFELWVDLILRLLFLGIVAWMRFALLPRFRHQTLGRWGIALFPIAILLLNVPMLQSGGVTAVFHALDGIVNGILVAVAFESITAGFIGTVVFPERHRRISSIERLQHLRSVIDIQKRVVLALTVLILLALYVLARTFLFDWVLYARIGAALAGLGFVLPLMVLKTKVQKESENELLQIEKEVGSAVERQLFRLENGLEPADDGEFSFWLDYRRVLLQSTMIPLTWESWFYLLFLLVIILIEPYLFGVWMI